MTTILHLGAYDRMILMVFYLESKYGKDWAEPHHLHPELRCRPDR